MWRYWNKSNICEFTIFINDTLVYIRTHERKLNIVKLPSNDDVRNEITIWFDVEISQKCLQLINDAFAYGKAIVPKPICDAYDYLGLSAKQMENHINKYVVYDGMVYAYYAFPSDNFYLIYNKNQNELFLWGNKPNLERILISILSMTGKILPFHAACIQYNQKGYMIIGDTGSGKTALTLEMLKRGASYISDDILYVENDLHGLRCNSYLSLRNKYVGPEAQTAVEVIKADKTFLDLDILCSLNGWRIKDNTSIDEIVLISPLTIDKATCTKLFCTFRHDSMFALEYFKGNIKEKLDDT